MENQNQAQQRQEPLTLEEKKMRREYIRCVMRNNYIQKFKLNESQYNLLEMFPSFYKKNNQTPGIGDHMPGRSRHEDDYHPPPAKHTPKKGEAQDAQCVGKSVVNEPPKIRKPLATICNSNTLNPCSSDSITNAKASSNMEEKSQKIKCLQ